MSTDMCDIVAVRSMLHSFWRVATSVALTAGIAGCGGGDDNSGTVASNTPSDPRASNQTDPTAHRLSVTVESTPSPRRAKVSSAIVPSPIVSSPRNLWMVPGQAGYLTATVNVGANDSIEWLSAGVDAPIACAQQLRQGNIFTCVLENATLENNGSLVSLRVLRDGVASGFVSIPATITVTASAQPPSMVEEPVSQTVPAGQVAEFSALAYGTQIPPNSVRDRSRLTDGMVYRWQKNGVPIPGANGPTLRLPTTLADARSTSEIAVRVNNAEGFIVSESAILTVAPPETTISASGASVPGPAGMTLDIPAGAMPTGTVVSITSAPVPVSFLPDGVSALGDILIVGAGGAGLSKPAKLAFDGPDELPPGIMLALLELDSSVLRQNSGPRRALPANITCIHPQDSTLSKSGRYRFQGALNFIGPVLPATVPVGECTEIQARPSAPPIPLVTDAACVADDDFFPISYISQWEQTLVSRNVDCRRGEGVLVDLEIELDATQDPKTGVITEYRIVSDVTIPPGPNTIRGGYRYGSVIVQARLSVFGPSNRLAKQLGLQIRALQFFPNSGYPSIAPKPPSIRFRPDFSCIYRENGPPFNQKCGFGTLPEVTVELPREGPAVDRPWPSPKLFTVSFDWTKPVGNYADVAEFRVAFYRLNWKVSGGDYRLESPPDYPLRWTDLALDSSPWVRCDRKMAQANSDGCIFEYAAAVFDVKAIVNAQDAIDHIAAAQAGSGHVSGLQPLPSPGKFKMLPGSIAVADVSVTGNFALQRLKNRAKQNENREEACDRSLTRVPKSIIRERAPPTNASASCGGPNGPVIESGACSCDEYPFASTWQGAFYGDRDRVSAKFILASDNSAAGSANLTNALTKLRVIDMTDHSIPNVTSAASGSDYYWVWVGVP